MAHITLHITYLSNSSPCTTPNWLELQSDQPQIKKKQTYQKHLQVTENRTYITS